MSKPTRQKNESMASLPCSHFFVALLVHLRQVHPLVCVVALLVHFLLWQAAKPSGDKCTPFVCVVCFVDALEASAPPLCALLLCWCTSCSGKRQSRAETSAPPLCAFVALLVQLRQLHPLMLIILRTCRCGLQHISCPFRLRGRLL